MHCVEDLTLVLEEREKHSAITDCFYYYKCSKNLMEETGELISIHEEIIDVPNKIKKLILNLPKS